MQQLKLHRTDAFCYHRSTIRNDSDQIDDIHEVLEEDDVIWTSGKAKRKLGREPDDTDRLDNEERFVGSVIRVLFQLVSDRLYVGSVMSVSSMG